MLDWRQLLSASRRAGEPPDPVDPGRSPFQKDFDRIVFSSAFRRLQDKTQAHPLPGNDYIRTRLTHSMEVASVGRSLGAAAGQIIAGRRRLPPDLNAPEFGNIVSAACLAHDIGNPPFGHRGEHLIRDWFRKDRLARSALVSLSQAEQQDFLMFEGNAQGFRILTRLQNWTDDGGMRLTAATLGAFSKYPCVSDAIDGPGSPDVGARKFGVTQAEEPIFRTLADTLGLPERRSGRWRRHPLAWLVEAADDICYSVVDLEDGFKLGKLDFETVEGLLRPIAETGRRYREIEEPARRIAYLRAKTIGRLVEQAVRAFVDYEPQMLDEGAVPPLLDAIPSAPRLKVIASVTARDVFVPDDVFDRTLGADRVIRQLMTRTLEDTPQTGGAYQRLLRVCDHVSGMTDTYALQSCPGSVDSPRHVPYSA